MPLHGHIVTSLMELIIVMEPMYRVLAAPPQDLRTMLTMAWTTLLVALNMKPVAPSLTVLLSYSPHILKRFKGTTGRFPKRNPIAQAALAVCEITVATAAPLMPMPAL